MLIKRIKPGSDQRVLVTGSRGKSSIVRLLHAAFQQAGLQSYARITGVVPREFSPEGTRTILRSAGAHVGEMHWWLRKLPGSAECIVMENSAITPEFQALAGIWLRPDVTILSSVVPDHQEVWGPGSTSAAEVLAAGIPKDKRVIVPAELEQDGHLLDLLNGRRCKVIFGFSGDSAGRRQCGHGVFCQ
jgi:UDP-N-acetylmuramate-alanine ligase